ncbi:MAG: hypothetical protein FWC82_00015 [Firmicutes bacterium]|nr:hypothetical protein [Bacillota bacterium]
MQTDFFTYLSDTVDSIVNRSSHDQRNREALEELDRFLSDINSQRELPDRIDLGSGPELIRKEHTELTREQIEQNARDMLEGQRHASVNAIERDIEARDTKFREQKENAGTAAQTAREATEESFSNALQNVNSDVLRRGLARSSIAINRVGNLEETQAREMTRIGEALGREVQRLENEISGLVHQRERALADFDVAFASQLTNKIHTLQNEHDRRRNDVLVYNNALAEREAAAEVNRRVQEANIYRTELDNRIREDQILGGEEGRSRAIFNEMSRILEGMNPRDARQLIMTNHIFRDNLSDRDFFRLYDRFTR